MKKALLILMSCFLAPNLYAQDSLRVDPPNWWNNLQNPHLQLCIHAKDIGTFNKVSINNSHIKIESVETVENKNFLFVNILLQEFHGTQAIFTLLNKAGAKKTFTYRFEHLDKKINTINEKDIVYLVIPDRFSNGDTTNDIVAGLKEAYCNRDSASARHGGDIQGIINHLDYFNELGVTALWLNPTLINDQKNTSYHGYALTDHYLNDPRLGSNALYKELGKQLHSKGMKLVMDLVPNHIGSEHWMMHDMPEKSWVNQWPAFTRTNYRATTHFDPYASNYDKKQMVDGWFDNAMPDMNERNPRVAKYLMQSYLWWINYAQIDGFRIDTYSYNDVEFMNQCMAYIRKEYPNFWSAGEIWESAGVLNMAYFTEKNKLKNAPNSNLSGAIDFQVYFSILEALQSETNWNGGLAKLYNTLTHDFLYHQPSKNLCFIENHDLDRFYSLVGKDMSKWKIGMGLLFTLRGIPSLYQAGEILAKNNVPRRNDGLVRKDFKGGWPNDPINKFTATGRTAEEEQAFQFSKQLIAIRKNNPVLATGKLMQFVPNGSTYTFCRYTDTSCILVSVNRGKEKASLNKQQLAERMNGYTKAWDLLAEKEISLEQLEIAPNEIKIIALKK